MRCYWRIVSCTNDENFEITVEISDGRGSRNKIVQSLFDEHLFQE